MSTLWRHVDHPLPSPVVGRRWSARKSNPAGLGLKSGTGEPACPHLLAPVLDLNRRVRGLFILATQHVRHAAESLEPLGLNLRSPFGIELGELPEELVGHDLGDRRVGRVLFLTLAATLATMAVGRILPGLAAILPVVAFLPSASEAPKGA